MRTRMHRLVVAGVAALLAGLVVAAVAVADATFTDPTGDATGGAPDIAQVDVSNDISGLITFKVTTVAPLVDRSVIGIDLDTDLAPANGPEYGLLAGLGGAGLVKWDGTSWVDVPATVLVTRSANVLELKVNRSDLGNPTKFGFDVVSLIFDASDKIAGEDSSPDGGEYTYSVVLPQCSNGKDDDGDGKIDAADLGCSSSADVLESDDPVTLKVGSPIIVPAKGRAGKLVIVGVPVVRVETGKAIPSGTVKCAAKAGAKSIPGRGQIVAGGAACGFKVPLSAKGKTVRGTLTVTYLGKKKVVKFSFKAN